MTKKVIVWSLTRLSISEKDKSFSVKFFILRTSFAREKCENLRFFAKFRFNVLCIIFWGGDAKILRKKIPKRNY